MSDYEILQRGQAMQGMTAQELDDRLREIRSELYHEFPSVNAVQRRVLDALAAAHPVAVDILDLQTLIAGKGPAWDAVQPQSRHRAWRTLCSMWFTNLLVMHAHRPDGPDTKNGGCATIGVRGHNVLRMDRLRALRSGS